ncbi:MAG: hypothetical protein AAFX04_13150 [Pseudomonadota bacterium]
MPGDGKDTTPLNLKSDFTLSANEHELRSQALAAYTADDKGTSIILAGSQRSATESRSADSRKRQSDQQQTQLSIADQACRLSAQLDRQIAALEDAFEAEMGDAWREQIANKVMDPDDIPQRREDETMADYRERLETVLIATMIDENGQIRAEYADDPDTARYAEWAQAQYRKREVDAHLERRNDPALSDTERDALDRDFAASSTYDNARRVVDDHAKQAVDNRHIEATSTTSSEAANFGV